MKKFTQKILFYEVINRKKERILLLNSGRRSETA